MADPLRCILVGAGAQGLQWARHTLPSLAKRGIVTPVALVEPNAERCELAKTALGLSSKQCFADLGDAVEARKAEFAIIATPPSSHEKIVEVAFLAELDIIMEFPASDTMEGTLHLYRKAKYARRRMVVAASARYEQDKQTLEQQIKGRHWGRLDYLVCRSIQNLRRRGSSASYRYEMTHPVYIEDASHEFDVFRSLTSPKAKTVFSIGWNPPHTDFRGDSIAVIIVEMADGARCIYEGSKANACSLNPPGLEYYRVEMEKATLELDRRNLRRLVSDKQHELSATPIPLLEADLWGNALLTKQFCDWIRGGEAPANTIKDHLQTAALLHAAIESARIEKTVDVQAFFERHAVATRKVEDPYRGPLE